MFYPDRLQSILPCDKVLEIGPGALPHPRANAYLDKRFDDPVELDAQFGLAKRKEKLENLTYYDGGKFPYADNAFDYTICSHVIEHVEESELDLFFSELTRVSQRGYIEVPNVFYELICYTHVHKWLIGNEGKTLRFYRKDLLPDISIFTTFRSLFYNCDQNLIELFPRYREVFFIGFEWEDNIDYCIVDSLDKLFGERELAFLNGKITTSDFYGGPPLPSARELLKLNMLKLRDILRRRCRLPL